MICKYCEKDKPSTEFYARGDGKGLRAHCKECMKFQARINKLAGRIPMWWPPTRLSWLTPLEYYNADQDCSIMEHPCGSVQVYARNIISDPPYTAEDDEQSTC